MSDVSEAEVKELLPFLSNDLRPDVRSTAMQYFLGISGSRKGRNFLREHPECLAAIMRTMSDNQETIARDALLAIVNIATDEGLAWRLVHLDSHPQFVSELIGYVLKAESAHADIACMALSNLSRTDRCSRVFVDQMIEKKDTIGFDKLIEVFCKEKYNKKANLHYLGPFFCNLTQVKEARKYVLDKSRCVIQRLLPYTQYKASLIRRGGVVSTLRNCCFETEFHDWLLSEAIDLLPHLLLPLAGPEEFDDDDMERLPVDLQFLEPDKEREEDPDIRKMLVECITQMCATKPCREYIKEKNAYVIIREYHKTEEDPAANASIETLVQVLLQDEPTDPKMQNFKEVDIPPEMEAKLDKLYISQQQEIQKETEELEAKKAKELEAKKAKELEAKKAKELEAKKAKELEAKKAKELEAKKAEELEANKVAEKK